MRALSLSLLGPFQLIADGLPPPRFDSAKVRALLAFLAIESARPHSREALAGLLWPERPERAARHSLSQAISNLRQILGDHRGGPPCIEGGRDALRFNPEGPCGVDVQAVDALLNGCAEHSPRPHAACARCAELLARGVALVGGSFLEGFSLADAAPFEEWARHHRDRLARRQLEALCSLGEHELVRGNGEGARHWARRQIELDPLHEPGHRQLMRAYAGSGLRAAALRQYHEYARALDAELGVLPADETQQLYEQIKLQPGPPLFDERQGPPASPRAQQFPEEVAAQPASPSASSLQPSAFGPAPLFVGREAELARLADALALALAGRGQVAFVTGETGSGKTALLQEFARRAVLADERVIVVSGNCNAHTGRGDPYLPFREVLGALTGDVATGRAQCLAPLAQAPRLRAAFPVVAEAIAEQGPDLVGTFVAGAALVARAAALLPAAPDPMASREEPARIHGGWRARLEQLAERRATPPLEQLRLFEQVAAVLTALARRRPLVLLLDDLQWADAGSASLLFQLGRAIGASSVLIVGAYRPEEVSCGREGARHPLEPVVNELRRIFGHPAVELDGGDVAEARRFVDALLDAEPNTLGPSFRQALLQQTSGHPLFTVELLRDMQSRGDLVRDSQGRWCQGPRLDWECLPARVEGAIAERVARLDEAERELLLVAAVEGASFTAEVVAHVQSAEGRAVVRRLSGELDRRHRLVCALGVGQAGERRLATYSFRHILFQRYLYGRLDPVERAYLHEEVGAALEALYGEQTDQIAVQLAHHFHQAGDPARASRYLRRAGERALTMAAYEEALSLFGRAIELVAALPPGPARDQQELTLQVARAVPLAGTRGYAHPEVERSYARARALCRSADPSPELFATLWGLFSYYLVRAEEQPMRELAAQLVQLARTAKDPALHMVGHWALGVTSLYAGDPTDAREHFERMAARRGAGGEAAAALFATDPTVACHFWTAWALWLLGRPDEAIGRSYAALARAEGLGHPFSMAYALFTGTALLQFRREPQAALGWAEATVALATRHGFSFFQGLGTVFQGWALAEQGRADEGLALMEQGLAAAKATGARIGLPHMLALLAEARGRRGDPARGLQLVAEALSLAQTTGERHYEAELYRLRGVLLQDAPPQGGAETPEACLRRAVELARAQGAVSLELRASVSLCRLLAATGRAGEGRGALLACYNCFEEGFATPDLLEARALLEQLSPALAA